MATVVCAMSFTGPGQDGEPVTIAEGVRLDEGNPIVKRWPQFFASDSDDARMALNRKLMAEAEEAAAVSRGTTTRSTRILSSRHRAKRSVKLDVDGEERRIKKGDLLEPNDLLPTLVPDAFEFVSLEV
jgi:hypothetical protein